MDRDIERQVVAGAIHFVDELSFLVHPGVVLDDSNRETSAFVSRSIGVRTPLLVIAGGEDWRCPPSQSERVSRGPVARRSPSRLWRCQRRSSQHE
ncbi:hypothetical protein C8039_03470 [Halogeometricum sp. wsp3]|nr:hypothetical protein C8039_03470 [Halogeometricum sp. wsp3]